MTDIIEHDRSGYQPKPSEKPLNLEPPPVGSAITSPEIEKLRNEVDQLRIALNSKIEDVRGIRADRDQLHACFHAANVEIEKLRAEVTRYESLCAIHPGGSCLICKSFASLQRDNVVRQEQKVKDLECRLREIRTAVNEQAGDEALWLLDVSVTEAYLQRELRKLHALIEKNTKTAGDSDG